MFNKLLVLFLIICSFSSVYSTFYRKTRFSPLSLFSFVTFDNNECKTSDTNNPINGTCYTSQDCTQLRGVGRGTCAEGRGVCCVFENTCGNTSHANVSYFVNPHWPQSYDEPSSCTFKVNKLNQQICQLRIDFDEFDIAGPTELGPNVNLKHVGSSFGSINSESNCKDDLFVITQSNRNQPIPILCGHNRGQHLFIPVDESDSNSIGFTFLTGIKNFNRKWKIKITQLPCSLSQESLAPQGCLQFFTTNKGLIKTFNFERKRYLQNIDYSICIRKPKNMCYLTLTTANIPRETTIPIMNESNTTTTTVPLLSEPRPIPEPIADPIPDRIPIPIFNYTNPVFPLRGRSVLQSTISRGESICRNGHYWITYPGSNRICSREVEPLIHPITISTNAHQVIHFHSLTWSQALESDANSAEGFAVEFAHSPCTHGFI